VTEEGRSEPGAVNGEPSPNRRAASQVRVQPVSKKREKKCREGWRSGWFQGPAPEGDRRQEVKNEKAKLRTYVFARNERKYTVWHGKGGYRSIP